MGMIKCAFSVALAACLVAAVASSVEPTLATEAAGKPQETVLAASSAKEAIRLSAEPTQIPLGSQPLQGILDGLRAAGDAQHIYLVLDEVQAKDAPGLPFEVLIGTAGGAGAKSTTEKVGDIFLYDLQPRRRSFDVTAAVKALLGVAPPDAQLFVTIQPPAAATSQPEGQFDLAAELERADVTLAGAQLVAQ
jgi:hypothetical protein